MAAAVASPPKIVDTTLNHYLDPDLGGHNTYTAGIAAYYRRKFDEKRVKIQNIRGHEDKYNLNTQGFQFHLSESVEKDFTDSERVKRLVYPETEELLKQV